MPDGFHYTSTSVFVAVAEQDTVSGAAKAMSISQSSVTDAVKTLEADLEADLGLKLFLRRQRGLEITHTGHQFLRHAQKILSDVSDARHVFDTSSEQPRGKLSLGVALARALLNRPRVLLLDEPLGALDLKLREQMQEELKALQTSLGITFVFVTHDQGEASSMADRLAVRHVMIKH